MGNISITSLDFLALNLLPFFPSQFTAFDIAEGPFLRHALNAFISPNSNFPQFFCSLVRQAWTNKCVCDTISKEKRQKIMRLLKEEKKKFAASSETNFRLKESERRFLLIIANNFLVSFRNDKTKDLSNCSNAIL